MQHKVYLIAQREWLENVRTKAFWISLLLLPVILAASMIVPVLIEKSKSARTFAVLDQSGWLLEAVEQQAMQRDFAILLSATPDPEQEAHPAVSEILGQLPEDALQKAAAVAAVSAAIANDQSLAGNFSGDLTTTVASRRNELQQWWHSLPSKTAQQIDRNLSKARFQIAPVEGLDQDALNQKVLDKSIFAYFLIDPNPVSATASHRYVSSNLSDEDLSEWFSSHADEAVRKKRIEQQQIDPSVAALLQQKVRFQRTKVSETGEEEQVSLNDRLRQLAPAGFVYLLFIAILSVSQMLLSNTVEEKSNRLMEVLLSSVSPFQLMMGKILGIAATGMTMVVTWMLSFFVLSKVIPQYLGTSNLDLGFILGDPVFLASFVVYFLLAFLFYSAIIGAIGSVCNTLKEAQALQTPVMIFMIAPLLLMVPISRDPDGTLAQVLSYVPPMTPFVMMNRAAGDPSIWEYLITTVLMLVSIFIAIWGAAKVFRIGVLMTGKPPSIREMFRWLREPVGSQTPSTKQPTSN